MNTRRILRILMPAVTVLLSFTACVAAAAPASAPLSPEEQAFFQQQPSAATMTNIKRLTNPALAQVFAATFYRVGVRLTPSASAYSIEVFARVGSSLQHVELPTSNAPMPDLLKLLKPDFRLKTEADAKTLQSALDDVYPVVAVSSQDKAVTGTILHSGNVWTLVRGTFFKVWQGIIITTGDNGAITAAEFSLKIPPASKATPTPPAGTQPATTAAKPEEK